MKWWKEPVNEEKMWDNCKLLIKKTGKVYRNFIKFVYEKEEEKMVSHLNWLLVKNKILLNRIDKRNEIKLNVENWWHKVRAKFAKKKFVIKSSLNWKNRIKRRNFEDKKLLFLLWNSRYAEQIMKLDIRSISFGDTKKERRDRNSLFIWNKYLFFDFSKGLIRNEDTDEISLYSWKECAKNMYAELYFSYIDRVRKYDFEDSEVLNEYAGYDGNKLKLFNKFWKFFIYRGKGFRAFFNVDEVLREVKYHLKDVPFRFILKICNDLYPFFIKGFVRKKRRLFFVKRDSTKRGNQKYVVLFSWLFRALKGKRYSRHGIDFDDVIEALVDAYDGEGSAYDSKEKFFNVYETNEYLARKFRYSKKKRRRRRKPELVAFCNQNLKEEFLAGCGKEYVTDLLREQWNDSMLNTWAIKRNIYYYHKARRYGMIERERKIIPMDWSPSKDF